MLRAGTSRNSSLLRNRNIRHSQIKYNSLGSNTSRLFQQPTDARSILILCSLRVSIYLYTSGKCQLKFNGEWFPSVHPFCHSNFLPASSCIPFTFISIYNINKKIMVVPCTKLFQSFRDSRRQSLNWLRHWPEGSLQCSQNPAILHYPEPDESRPHPHTLFI
jgi:hypothetical protein